MQNIGGVLCAEYCQCLQPLAFLAFGPLSLIILWPLSEHFSAFDNVNPIFAIFENISPEEQTWACVCSRGAAAAGDCGDQDQEVARRGWGRPGPGG